MGTVCFLADGTTPAVSSKVETAILEKPYPNERELRSSLNTVPRPKTSIAIMFFQEWFWFFSPGLFASGGREDIDFAQDRQPGFSTFPGNCCE